MTERSYPSYIYSHLEVRPKELAGFLHWSIGYGNVSIAYFVHEKDALIALDAIKLEYSSVKHENRL